MLFRETDDIIRLGKHLFLQIPGETIRCGECPLLGDTTDWRGIHYYCALRPSFGLTFDNIGAFKSNDCPKRKTE